jgi:excisionase family DNA binding protein
MAKTSDREEKLAARAAAREARKKRPYPTRSHPGVAGRKLLSTVAVRDVTFRVDKLYAPKEVALILGVCTRTVENWIAAGKLTAYKLGDAPNAPVRVHGRTILNLLKKVVKIKREKKAREAEAKTEKPK